MTTPRLKLVGSKPGTPATSLGDVVDVIQAYADDRRDWRVLRPATDADRVALKDLVLVIATALDGGGWGVVRRLAEVARHRGSDERRAAVMSVIGDSIRAWRVVAISIRKRGESNTDWAARTAQCRKNESTLAMRIVEWLTLYESAFGKLSPRDVADLFRRRGARREVGIAAELSMRCQAFGDVNRVKAAGAFRGAVARQRSQKRKATKSY